MLIKCWSKCSATAPFTNKNITDIVQEVFVQSNAELDRLLYHGAVGIMGPSDDYSGVGKIFNSTDSTHISRAATHSR